MGFKTLAVVNPNSANGSTRKTWPRISEEIAKYAPEFKYVFTTHSGHATELTRQGLLDGYEMIVAVGGDGTNNEVVNGFFENGAQINPDAVFSHVTQGTGGDLRRTLGTPREFEKSTPILAGEATRIIDVGRMTLFNHEGREVTRYFLNIASAGIGGEVDARVNRTTKIFGGFFSFAWAALGSFATYRNKPVRVTVDGQTVGDFKALNCVVANGQFFGGGMHVAPYAKMDDGLFDIVIMGDLSLMENLTAMPKIYAGKHIEHPKVKCLTGKKVELYSDDVVLLDVDGEQPGRIPSTFEILPSTLRVKIFEKN